MSARTIRQGARLHRFSVRNLLLSVATLWVVILVAGTSRAADKDFDLQAGVMINATPKSTQPNCAELHCLEECLAADKFDCKAVDYNRQTATCRLFDVIGPTTKNAQYNYYVVKAQLTPSGTSDCWAGADRDAGLCYKKCRDGYKGVGPVCWERCPAGLTDDGATCRKPVEVKSKTSYGRTAGKPMGCGANEELDGGLCYKKCRDGYKGVGPVCWQGCPSGFRDDGAYCKKPEAYGRGIGRISKSLCEKHNGDGNCEKDAGLWYQKCKAGFHATGCCICSPNCPSGMKDIGVSCQKEKAGRGVGTPLDTCPGDLERDGALCYPRCRKGYRGAGPMCWSECPSGYKDDGATCRKPGDIVAKKSYGRGVGSLQRGSLRGIISRYIRDHYRMYNVSGKPITQAEKTYLKQWFPARLVDNLKVYEMAGMTGTFIHTADATTYGKDLVVVKMGRRSNDLLKHEMVHVCQYDKLGRDAFSQAYADQYVDAGYNYDTMLFEQDAFGFAGRAGTARVDTYTGADGSRGSIYAACKD